MLSKLMRKCSIFIGLKITILQICFHTTTHWIIEGSYHREELHLEDKIFWTFRDKPVGTVYSVCEWASCQWKGSSRDRMSCVQGGWRLVLPRLDLSSSHTWPQEAASLLSLALVKINLMLLATKVKRARIYGSRMQLLILSTPLA